VTSIGAAAASWQLNAQQRAVVATLRATDRSVRAHEQAHLAAAGAYATSGAVYGYSVGPDGQLYATSGEVSLDVSPDASDPEKTIEKARIIEAAANAPADPSTQDRMVAAMAAQMQATAQAQLAQEQSASPTAKAYGNTDSRGLGSLLSLLG
jgi:hypothetical protein